MDYLEQVEFPATKEDLIDAADAAGAPQELIECLQSLDGEQFAGPEAVEAAVAAQQR
jgi:hypothetical protein